jgi:hypothetical protein
LLDPWRLDHRLSRNVGNKSLTALPLKMGSICVPKRRLPTTNQRWVTSQKSEDLIYTAAEVWNRMHVELYGYGYPDVNVVQSFRHIWSSSHCQTWKEKRWI